MPHHRASTRITQKGEPVFLCFCGMTNFHRFKLGFDRTFWIGEIADKSQEAVYQVAVDSQKAALEVLGPGVPAEDVHKAYADVIQGAGYEYPFRCGRATGFSFLEKPELGREKQRSCCRPFMVTIGCHPIRIFCKLWLQARISPCRITGLPPGLCKNVNRFFSVSVA